MKHTIIHIVFILALVLGASATGAQEKDREQQSTTILGAVTVSVDEEAFDVSHVFEYTPSSRKDVLTSIHFDGVDRITLVGFSGELLLHPEDSPETILFRYPLAGNNLRYPVSVMPQVELKKGRYTIRVVTHSLLRIFFQDDVQGELRSFTRSKRDGKDLVALLEKGVNLSIDVTHEIAESANELALQSVRRVR